MRNDNLHIIVKCQLDYIRMSHQVFHKVQILDMWIQYDKHHAVSMSSIKIFQKTPKKGLITFTTSNCIFLCKRKISTLKGLEILDFLNIAILIMLVLSKYFIKCFTLFIITWINTSLRWFLIDFLGKMPYQIGHRIDLLMYNDKLDEHVTWQQFHSTFKFNFIF